MAEPPGPPGPPDPPDPPEILRELRVLDGPNLYFTRPAIKLTLDLAGLAGLPPTRVLELAAELGVPGERPGEPDSEQRQRFLLRLAGQVTREVAGRAGTRRLAVRARATSDNRGLVVAFPWRHEGRARALGEAVAGLLAELGTRPAGALLDEAATRVQAAEPGPGPDLPSPTIPVVSVTGTNGKTTTTRLIGHLGRTAGLHTGWTNSDGIYRDGELVEEGDWSGPGGARQVLAWPELQLAVLETARGGLLLRGMGVDHNDVAVVTNVSADHLGLQGIDTLDQLAEVKSTIVRVTKATGWVVLNGDDPRTLAMRTLTKASCWVFSLDPDSPSLRAVLAEGGRGMTVLDGDVVVLRPDADPEHLVPVVEVPVSLAGLSRHNLANVLAASAAALAVGLTTGDVVRGLRSFQPDPSDNPGRMNLYTLRGVTVIVDLAHNEAGLAALLEIMDGLREPGRSIRLVLGTAGDRLDGQLQAMGEMAARGADDVLIGHKERYLRGRTTTEMAQLFRAGAAMVGVPTLDEEPTELDGLRTLVERSVPGDVVAVMCHAQRAEIYDWLATAGAVVDSAESIRTKVLRHRGADHSVG